MLLQKDYMNIKKVLVFTINMALYTTLFNVQSAWNTNVALELVRQSINIHVEQTERADGKWDVKIYKKQPIGFYDETVQLKKKYWRVCAWATALTFASGAGAVAMDSPALLYVGCVSLLTALITPLLVLGQNTQLKKYEKDFKPTDSNGNPIVESYEYYRAYSATVPQMPVKIQPTIVTRYATQSRV